jgi:DNA-binding NarL/FixJ family response regulator
LEEALAIGREVDDKKTLVLVFNDLATLATRRADYQAAYSLFEENLIRAREFGPPWALADALQRFGFLLVKQGEYEKAQNAYAESASVWRALKDKNSLATPLRMLGYLAVRRNEYEQAIALCRESLALNVEVGDKRGVAASLSALASIVIARKNWIHAAQLCGVSEALLASIHAQFSAANLDIAIHEQNLASLRAQLDPAIFEQAWNEGRAMALEQAIILAEQLPTIKSQSFDLASSPSGDMDKSPTPIPTLPTPPHSNPAGLTEREVEVLRWLVQGLTDGDIAEQLVVSRRTVHAHLRSIYSKLDVTTRNGAVRVAIENKLV